MNPVLSTLVRKPHVTGSAIVYAGSFVIPYLGVIWMPTHAEQWKQTAHLLQHAAATWGFVAGMRPKHGEKDQADQLPQSKP